VNITVNRHVNGRTSDGRSFAAGEGTRTVVDDGDEPMVALMREWAATGDVQITDEQAEKSEPDEEAAELDQLRAEAEAAGVKVDGRWGVDRLREEIAAAQETGK
jgi:hypothetical protein